MGALSGNQAHCLDGFAALAEPLQLIGVEQRRPWSGRAMALDLALLCGRQCSTRRGWMDRPVNSEVGPQGVGAVAPELAFGGLGIGDEQPCFCAVGAGACPFFQLHQLHQLLSGGGHGHLLVFLHQ